MASIAAASAHQMRERPTANADPNSAAPITMHLANGKSPYQAVRYLLNDAIRRNRDTVLCREIVLSASPSYFRPGRECLGGLYDPERVKVWSHICLAWAKRKWPDQLASVVLHLDEQTPHMHLLVVPRISSDGNIWKLNSKALFDRERLRELQTEYGEAVNILGIKRGEPGSSGIHTDVKKFYGAIKKGEILAKNIDFPKPPPRPRPVDKVSDLIYEKIARKIRFETKLAMEQKMYKDRLNQWHHECAEIQKKNESAQKLASAAATYIRETKKKIDELPKTPPARAANRKIINRP